MGSALVICCALCAMQSPGALSLIPQVLLYHPLPALCGLTCFPNPLSSYALGGVGVGVGGEGGAGGGEYEAGAGECGRTREACVAPKWVLLEGPFVCRSLCRAHCVPTVIWYGKLSPLPPTRWPALKCRFCGSPPCACVVLAWWVWHILNPA